MPRNKLMTEKARRYYDILIGLNDIACEDVDEDLSDALLEFVNDTFGIDEEDADKLMWK